MDHQFHLQQEVEEEEEEMILTNEDISDYQRVFYKQFHSWANEGILFNNIRSILQFLCSSHHIPFYYSVSSVMRNYVQNTLSTSLSSSSLMSPLALIVSPPSPLSSLDQLFTSSPHSQGSNNQENEEEMEDVNYKKYLVILYEGNLGFDKCN